MQLQHPFLPCIVIREETYLPLEVCNVVEVCKQHINQYGIKLFLTHCVLLGTTFYAQIE
jgi:hypothetical protein